MIEFIDMDVVSPQETFLRVFLALAFGLVLGMERDRKDKPIDFRAYMIVGTATGASIWAAGGIGLCLGFGMYGLAGIGFMAVALVLIAGGFLSKKDET